MKRTGPLVMTDAFKSATDDQEKIRPPEETVAEVKKKLGSLNLSILESTFRIDNGRLGIPVFFSVCGHDAKQMIGTAKQMGKGATAAQAEASAIMELVERFSFFSFYRNDAHARLSTLDQLGGEALGFDQIAKSVHDESDDLEVAEKIFRSLPLRWTGAWNMTRESEVLVPIDWFYAINAFNGPSAGNCVPEAICQGLCEVVERHVSSLVSRNTLPVPRIDPESAADPMVREMLEKYRSAGIHLTISDFSLDMGIPTVGVLAWDPSTFPEKSEIVWTAGTTPSPEKALSRALTEVAQLAGDFNTGSNYVASGLPKFYSPADADFVIQGPGPVPLSGLPDLSHPNIRVEVASCVSALSRKNMDVLVVDTTHPKLSIPAFYTLVPGAHFRERAANTSVALFAAKLVAEQFSPDVAIHRLLDMDRMLPKKYFIQFYLGNAFLEKDDPERALEYFTKALDSHPAESDMPSIYSYMGICYKNMENYDAALSVLKKGAELDPDRIDIHNLMGFCHFMKKEHEAAISCFEKAIGLDPGSAIDYANIGSNYRELGQMEKAVQYYRLALELDPTIAFARDNLKRLGASGFTGP
ncbi:YcaO-like family protein [Desulfosarcina sp. OttesenSCG-928-A07]|nr:YcaO-like family protein [Desulfosarcina sp. OttesenSCG-928-G17]MDL2329485.1 YcaO-like family protein [Desulfosarcina sp. OttesenSCG-928-A07]